MRGNVAAAAVLSQFAQSYGSTQQNTLYCPVGSDLIRENGNIKIENGGWTITGGGRLGTKASFNLLGGFIDFDFDTTDANPAVNTNLYTVSPQNGFKSSSDYCDAQSNQGHVECLEMDVIETNGNCVMATTWYYRAVWVYVYFCVRMCACVVSN